MYADKLSMAHGLELRVPFVDKEIVEYVERLPASFKVRNGSYKWLHLHVCQNLLPAEIYRQVTRDSSRARLTRRKRGFATDVVDDWFRTAKPQKIADNFLDRGSPIYRYLRYSAVREMIEQHRTGRDDNHKILFSLVVFEEWLKGQSFGR
jgi:asparagine synthase (glutamine-hydrolysing)